MFCPQCRAEYRPGFTRCADCDVDLVNDLPAEPDDAEAARSELADPRTIWIGDQESDCLALCKDLKAANVPYEVAQLVKGSRGRMGVNWRYELAVSAENERHAKELLQLPDKVVEWNSETSEEEDESQALLEYAERFKPDLDEPRRRRDYLKPFYPDDASVEIWQTGPEGHSGIQSALKENYIRVRMETQPDGSLKLFVLPEDEAAAREIVREIVGDSPYP